MCLITFVMIVNQTGLFFIKNRHVDQLCSFANKLLISM